MPGSRASQDVIGSRRAEGGGVCEGVDVQAPRSKHPGSQLKLEITDYNKAEVLCSTTYSKEWEDVASVLSALPLHLKASDQAGIQGSWIFDPVGTNHHIKAELVKKQWRHTIPIPVAFDFLGKDVDLGKAGVLGEVQFSNYPFLLNNAMRSELLYKSKTVLTGEPVSLVVIITKAKMFPASNSTLYYEQARAQLSALIGNAVFEVPMRLVGLFEEIGKEFTATFTSYHAARYSRTVTEQIQRRCILSPGQGPRSRGVVRILD